MYQLLRWFLTFRESLAYPEFYEIVELVVQFCACLLHIFPSLFLRLPISPMDLVTLVSSYFRTAMSPVTVPLKKVNLGKESFSCGVYFNDFNVHRAV